MHFLFCYYAHFIQASLKFCSQRFHWQKVRISFFNGLACRLAVVNRLLIVWPKWRLEMLGTVVLLTLIVIYGSYTWIKTSYLTQVFRLWHKTVLSAYMTRIWARCCLEFIYISRCKSFVKTKSGRSNKFIFTGRFYCHTKVYVHSCTDFANVV